MNKISRRQFLRVSAVAGAGAVLAACGGGTEAPTEAPVVDPVEVEVVATKPAPATATPKAAVVEVEPIVEPEAEQAWPRADVAREQTLIYAFGDVEEPATGIGNLYANNWHQRAGSAMLEFPFYYCALNDKTYPWLAESWEYNDDTTEMTLYMRKGARWADGEALDANDVVFTYGSLKAAAPDYDNSGFVDTYMKSVEAVDDYTVKFVLNEPNPRWHFTGCTGRFDRGIVLVPEHIFSTVEGDWREFMYFDLEKKWPVYSGPYTVSRMESQVKHLDLRYEWWAVDAGLVDAMPQVERIVNFGWPGEEVAAQMLINNEIDVSLDLRPATFEAIFAQTDHILSHTGQEKPYGYMDWWPTSLFFNTLEAPYDNPDVRWAFAYAIDHQQVMDVGYGGAGVKLNLPFPGYPGLTKFRDNASAEVRALADAIYVQDFAKVEERMTAAGFTKNADGFFADASGEVFKPEILTVDLYADIGPVLVEQLRQAGFDATMINPPDAWTIMGDGNAKVFFR
ncbi:MAG: ABC transporter substrate-binding protein, partial [Anaerolineae bacterium]|nr:ABC transporter substrate-binding protein [Anaerolineae bacterium]